MELIKHHTSLYRTTGPGSFEIIERTKRRHKFRRQGHRCTYYYRFAFVEDWWDTLKLNGDLQCLKSFYLEVTRNNNVVHNICENSSAEYWRSSWHLVINTNGITWNFHDLSHQLWDCFYSIPFSLLRECHFSLKSCLCCLLWFIKFHIYAWRSLFMLSCG